MATMVPTCPTNHTQTCRSRQRSSRRNSSQSEVSPAILSPSEPLLPSLCAMPPEDLCSATVSSTGMSRQASTSSAERAAIITLSCFVQRHTTSWLESVKSISPLTVSAALFTTSETRHACSCLHDSRSWPLRTFWSVDDEANSTDLIVSFEGAAENGAVFESCLAKTDSLYSIDHRRLPPLPEELF